MLRKSFAGAICRLRCAALHDRRSLLLTFRFHPTPDACCAFAFNFRSIFALCVSFFVSIFVGDLFGYAVYSLLLPLLSLRVAQFFFCLLFGGNLSFLSDMFMNDTIRSLCEL